MKNKKVKTMGICLSVAVMTTAAGAVPVMAQSSTDSVQINVHHSDAELIELKVKKPHVDTEKVYDGTTEAKILELGEVSGFKAGDDVKVEATAHFSDKNAGIGKVITVTYELSGEDAHKYKTPQSVSFSGCKITPRELHLIDVKAADRAYDGDTSIHVESPGTFDRNDLISGDQIVLNFSNVSMTVEDPNVGEDKPVTVKGYVISGADSKNYTFCMPDDVSVTISPAAYEKSVMNQIKWTQTDFEYNGEEQKPEILPDSLPSGVTVESYSYSDDCTYPGMDKTAEAVLSSSDPNFTLTQSSVSTKWNILPCEPDLKIDYEAETVTVTYPDEYKDIPDMQTGIADADDQQESEKGISISLPLSKWELPTAENDQKSVELKGFLKNKQGEVFFSEPIAIAARPSFDDSAILEQLSGSWTVQSDRAICDNWDAEGIEIRLVFENGDFSPWQETASFTDLQPGTHIIGVEYRLKAIKEKQFASSIKKQDLDLYALTEASLSVNGSLKKTYDGSAASIAEDQYSYNGDSAITVTWLDQDGKELSEAPTEVGTYSVVLSAPASAHYTEVTTEPIPYTIEKAAAPEIAWPTASDLTYGQSLADSFLSSDDQNGSFVWKDDTVIPSVSDSGITLYTVVYQPFDTVHFDYTNVSLEHQIPASVQKAEAIIDVSDMVLSYTYNGEAQSVNTGAVLNHEEATLSYSIESVTDVGTYNVTVSAPETDNYLSASAQVTITVEKAAAPEIIWPTASDLTYGQSLADSVLSSEDQNGSFVWEDGAVVPSVSDSDTTSYTVIYQPADTDHFDYTDVSLEHPITVSVQKAEAAIDVSDMVLSYTYNGEAQSVDTGAVLNHEEATLSYSLDRVTDAGTYDVTISAPETDNYLSASAQVTITVEKAAAPEIIWPTASSITYGESLSQSILNDGSVQYGSFAWAQDVAPDAGIASYEVIFTPSDTENYNWDQDQYTSEISVETAKKPVSVTVENASKIYGEDDPEFAVSADGLLDDTFEFQTSRTEGEDVGTYEITADISQNPNYEITVTNGAFTIEPKQIPSVNMTTVCKVGCDPETQKQTVDISLSDGSAILTQGRDYEVSYLEASEEAPASITVTGIGNYTGTQQYSQFITDRFNNLCSFKASVIYDAATEQNILMLNTESNRTETGEELLDEYGKPVYSQRNLSLTREFLDSLVSQSISHIAFQVRDASLMIPVESLTQDNYTVRLAPMEYTDMTWREYVILDEYLELSGSYRVRITTPAEIKQETPVIASAADASETDCVEAETVDPELDVTSQITGLKVRITKPESDKTAEAEGTELSQRKILLVLRGSMEFDAARVELLTQSAINYYETALPGSGMICLVQDRPENEWQ